MFGWLRRMSATATTSAMSTLPALRTTTTPATLMACSPDSLSYKDRVALKSEITDKKVMKEPMTFLRR